MGVTNGNVRFVDLPSFFHSGKIAVHLHLYRPELDGPANFSHIIPKGIGNDLSAFDNAPAFIPAVSACANIWPSDRSLCFLQDKAATPAFLKRPNHKPMVVLTSQGGVIIGLFCKNNLPIHLQVDVLQCYPERTAPIAQSIRIAIPPEEPIGGDLCVRQGD